MLVSCPIVCPVKILIEALKKHHVIPRLLACKPTAVIDVQYPCDIMVHPGRVIVVNEVLKQPIVRFKADPDRFYTLMMVDLDVPPDGEWLIWLVGNIAGCDLALGQTLAAYDLQRGMVGVNIHRIVFLAYQQYLELDFDEVLIPQREEKGREQFNCNRFARKYALGNPIAANFFQVEYVWRWTPTFLQFENE
ncbi:protein D2 [Drosophila ficusphila]|uniref:protein D2 n=1 Tax=Drosophila ficusphila TaxID=30025 RepID=UPI0007E785D4|nr:protein D2 [Drosophila ficusphila]